MGTVKVTEPSSAKNSPTVQRGVICTAPVTGLDGGQREYQVSKHRQKSACWGALTPRPLDSFICSPVALEKYIAFLVSFKSALFLNRRERDLDPSGVGFWRTCWSSALTRLIKVIFFISRQAQISHGASWKNTSPTHLLVFNTEEFCRHPPRRIDYNIKGPDKYP